MRPPDAVSAIGEKVEVEVSFAAKSRDPNATALTYTCAVSAMLNLGGLK